MFPKLIVPLNGIHPPETGHPILLSGAGRTSSEIPSPVIGACRDDSIVGAMRNTTKGHLQGP